MHAVLSAHHASLSLVVLSRASNTGSLNTGFFMHSQTDAYKKKKNKQFLCRKFFKKIQTKEISMLSHH